MERAVASPAGHAESTFEFLNRVAGDYWEHPRHLVQTWAEHITDPADYHDLRQRFRSRDDEQFRSAFLELYLHECLVRAGYTVTIHPKVPDASRRPDFRAAIAPFLYTANFWTIRSELPDAIRDSPEPGPLGPRQGVHA